MKSSYSKGRAYEDSVAADYGRRQPGSGAFWNAKEDVLGEGIYRHFMFQLKNHTGKESFSIKLEDLNKLRNNSSIVGRTGVLMFRLGENKEFVILRRTDFEFLLQEEGK